MERFGIDALRVGCGGLYDLPRLQPQKRASGCGNEFGGQSENTEAIEVSAQYQPHYWRAGAQRGQHGGRSTNFSGVTRPAGNGRHGVLVQVELGWDARRWTT